VLFKGHAAPIPIDVKTWESEDMDGLKRQQIPLILAYAVTIHKCQGATLDSALIDIGARTFERGQAYVALSRVKSLDSLYIYDLDPDAFQTHEKVVKFYSSLQSQSSTEM
jgi:ATP-dependent DNA helicase PIF1